MRRRLYQASIAVTTVYWAALVYLMHAPIVAAEVTPSWIQMPNLDKLVHVALYGLLAVLVSLTVATRRWAGSLHDAAPHFDRAWWIVGGLCLYAVLDETTQPLTGRHCEPLDGLFDVVGAALGVWIFGRLWPKFVASLADCKRANFSSVA